MMNEAIEKPAFQPENLPWNRWERAARKRGLERTLAELGREVIRDADQHAWSEPLRQLCTPHSLERLLTQAPFLGRRLCEILLETDGLRVAYCEEKGKESQVVRLPGFGGQY